jgi:transposase-like protein
MNLIELNNRFPTELHCVKYMEKLRWGKKPRCAYCDSTRLSNRNKDLRFHCKDCSKTSSVTVNTNLHNTRMPLQRWFYAVAVITDAKKGISALQLQRNIGGHYETVWSMYHKIRELMMEENREIDELEGVVEMDETFIGGKPRRMGNSNFKPKKREKLDKQIKELNEEGFSFAPKGKNKGKYAVNPKRGRGTNNIPVVGIVQRNGNVVAEVMRTLSYDNLKTMVKKYIDEDDSVLITDSYSGYNSMKQIIDHIKVDHQQFYSYKGVNSNTIESFWAIIERGIMGQYHSVSARKLPNYVAEFVYKYNNREDTDFMFYELLEKLITPINR